MAYNVTSKSGRAPTVAIPGSKGSGRPAAQKGGGGNKAAGSVEPTAANSPTVTVSPDGTVTAEHFGPSASARQAARAAVQAQREHTRRVVALVSSKPERKPVVAKGTQPKPAPANIGFSEQKPSPQKATAEAERQETERLQKQLTSLQIANHDARNRNSVLASKAEAPRTVTVAAHTRKAPESRLKGTPQERKAARKTLQKARKVVARTTGVTGPLTPSQKKIAKLVSKETGGILKPRTVATQELQEESGEAARQREAEGNYDVLNIGYTDSGPIALTRGSEWSNAKTAAKATAEFFKGNKYEPGAEIPQILERAKGKPVAKQLEIIGNSGWASSEYAKNLAATSALVGEKHNPGAIKNLKEAKLAAKELGLKVGQSPGKPTKQVVTRYKAGLKAAETLAHSHIPYPTPDQHFGLQSRPEFLDCSAAVSWVLNKMGVLKTELTSGEMGTVLKPGPGAVTVFYNAGHTFMKIGEKYFGTSVDDSSRGLSFYKAPPQSYLDEFKVGHVPGLGKKEAIQLGFKLPSGGNAQSFPGMTISPSGTTATIESGEGATQTKPGFSKMPIRSLSAPQRMRQAEATLKAGNLAAGKEAASPTTSVLDELQRKYGAAA